MAFPVVNGVTVFIAPPEDYVVDFENPQSQNKLDHYLIFGLLGSFSAVCLAQRLYTQHFIAGGLKMNDVLVILAFVAAITMQSLQTWSISIGGLCHHAWEMPIEVFEKHMLSSYIVAPIFITCNGLSKTSLLVLYLQISPQRWFRMIIWACIGMVASYTCIIAGLLLFSCRPLRAAWDTDIMGTAECINTASLYIAIAIANIISDVVLFLIPLPTVFRLKMPIGTKIAAAAMFGIASVTVATSVVRMTYLPSLLNTTDIPWVAGPANVWSFVEVNLFIICTSLPSLRKFLKRFFPRIFDTGSGQQSYYLRQTEPSSHKGRSGARSYGEGTVIEMDRRFSVHYEDGKLAEYDGTNIMVTTSIKRGTPRPTDSTSEHDSEDGILKHSR